MVTGWKGMFVVAGVAALVGCSGASDATGRVRFGPRLAAKYATLQRTQPALVAACSDENDFKRAEALWSSLELEDLSLAEPLLLLGLQDPSSFVRAQVGQVIAENLERGDEGMKQICGKEIVGVLKDRVLYGDPDEPEMSARDSRCYAADALSHLMTSALAEEMLAALLDDARRTPARDRLIMWLLMEHGDKRMVPRIVPLLGKAEVYFEGLSRFNTEVTASPADRALFALVHLTGQDIGRYTFHSECFLAEDTPVPQFRTEANRTKSIATFRTWWKDHRNDPAYQAKP